MPGPRAHTAAVGLRPLAEVRQPTTPSMPVRRFRNNGWIIGAVIGGALGAYGGHRIWHEEAPENASAARAMIVFGLIGAGVGAVIGGVLGSK
ncbi:MAG: hypothetical protein V4558_15920 [Gemmatimonadota bacterium]